MKDVLFPVGLTQTEVSVLGEYSAGTVQWSVVEKIPLKRFSENTLPTMLIIFGGTYIAKTVIDGESVWAVLSRRKGRFRYGSYADDLETLLKGL